MLVFVEGGKPENLDKNPRSKARTNNKLNPDGTGPESNPGHIGGRRELSPLRHPRSQGVKKGKLTKQDFKLKTRRQKKSLALPSSKEQRIRQTDRQTDRQPLFKHDSLKSCAACGVVYQKRKSIYHFISPGTEEETVPERLASTFFLI